MSGNERVSAKITACPVPDTGRHHPDPRRIAESVADAWNPHDPPEPGDVIRRVADAGFRLTTFGRLGHCLNDARRQGDPPDPESFVCSLLPWADNHRYYKLLRCDLPPQPSSPRPRLLPY